MNVPNDLDVLLRDFYRAEMPHPWPKLKPPAAADLPPVRRAAALRQPARSRLVLAASLVFLWLGLWSLSGRLPDAPPTSAESASGKLEATRRGPGMEPSSSKQGETSWTSEREATRRPRPRVSR